MKYTLDQYVYVNYYFNEPLSLAKVISIERDCIVGLNNGYFYDGNTGQGVYLNDMHRHCIIGNISDVQVPQQIIDIEYKKHFLDNLIEQLPANLLRKLEKMLLTLA